MTDTDHNLTPSEHSTTVGGSTAGRVLACPASLNLNAQMPTEPQSDFADEGTMLHEAIEHALMEGLAVEDLQALVGRDFYKGNILTQERHDDALVPALEMFWAYVDAQNEELLEYKLEVRCPMNGIEDSFGTVDVLMKFETFTVIWDWKFGVGVFVSVKDNSQLKFYGRAAVNARPDYFGEPETDGLPHEDWRVVLVIAQPRLSEEPSVCELTFNDLEWFREDLVTAYDKAIDPELEPEAHRGEHCRWCQAKPICSAYEGVVTLATALAKAQDGTVMVPDTPDAIVAGDTILYSKDDLRDWLLLADDIDAWSKSVRSLAFTSAQNGFLPTGKKMVKKYGNTDYVKPTTAEAALARRGLSVDDRRVVKIISATQALKKLKALKKKPPKNFTHRPLTGVKMVDLDAAGDPVLDTASAGAAIAAAAGKAS